MLNFNFLLKEVTAAKASSQWAFFIILCIILFYVYVAGILFLLAYSTAMFLLGSYTAAALISLMHDSSLAALIASKVQPEQHITCPHFFYFCVLFALHRGLREPSFQFSVCPVHAADLTIKLTLTVLWDLWTVMGCIRERCIYIQVTFFCFQGFQAGTNYRNGHTGQLSTLSVLLSWAGGLGVTFVSLQVLYTDRNIVVQLVTIPICLCCLSLRLSYFYSFIFCLLGTRKSNFFLVTYTPHLSQLCLAGPGPLLQEQPGRH